MPNYEKMYYTLFNAITDALNEIELNQITTAIELLKKSPVPHRRNVHSNFRPLPNEHMTHSM